MSFKKYMSHDHKWDKEHFSYSKNSPCVPFQSMHTPSELQRIIILFLGTHRIDLHFLISHKRNPWALLCFWLQYIVFEIHPCCVHQKLIYFLVLSRIQLTRIHMQMKYRYSIEAIFVDSIQLSRIYYNLFIHSPSNGHLGVSSLGLLWIKYRVLYFLVSPD